MDKLVFLAAILLISSLVSGNIHVNVNVENDSHSSHHHPRSIHGLAGEIDSIVPYAHKYERPNPDSPNYFSAYDLQILNSQRAIYNPLNSDLPVVGGAPTAVKLAGSLPSGIRIYRVNNALVARNRPAEVDADGSPRAYNPSNTGLDSNQNGKDGSKWVGVAVHAGTNIPYIQGRDGQGPHPGYYISTTALYDSRYPFNNCAHWVDSEAIPYLVIPPSIAAMGARMGDFAVIYNEKNNKFVFAIVADSGPRKKYGEISMAAAAAIGVRNNPKNGGADNGVAYTIFPGSGHGQGTIPSVAEINSKTEQLWQQFGGFNTVKTVPKK